MTRKRIGVVGAGSWGTTMAIYMAKRGFPVTLYEYDAARARRIESARVNKDFLPGFRLPKNISVTNNLESVLDGSDIIFNAVPTQFIRPTYGQITSRRKLWGRAKLVNLSKGIEIRSGKSIGAVFGELFRDIGSKNYAVLSGPSHAEEVVIGLPTTVVIAGRPALTRDVQKLVSGPRLRLYTNPDVTGVELAGALKNCIAVAAGIAAGLGFGDNTLAALTTRGLAEIARLGRAMGGRAETFSGLAGMGDLIVTCFSEHSRNRRFGRLLGEGKSPEWIKRKYNSVAEGVPTSKAAVKVARRLGVEIPITQEVYNVVYHGKSPKRAVESLLARPFRSELG